MNVTKSSEQYKLRQHLQDQLKHLNTRELFEFSSRIKADYDTWDYILVVRDILNRPQ